MHSFSTTLSFMASSHSHTTSSCVNCNITVDDVFDRSMTALHATWCSVWLSCHQVFGCVDSPAVRLCDWTHSTFFRDLAWGCGGFSTSEFALLGIRGEEQAWVASSGIAGDDGLFAIDLREECAACVFEADALAWQQQQLMEYVLRCDEGHAHLAAVVALWDTPQKDAANSGDVSVH